MQHYQAYIKPIITNIDWLALPLSAPACIHEANFRKALHNDILSSIGYLYDLSVIDSAEKERLLVRLSNAYVKGGL